VPEKIASLRMYDAPTPVTTMKVPYPILLMHGLGQKADVWDGPATSYFRQDLGLSSGGTLRFSRGALLPLMRRGSADADFYTVSFSSPHDSINAWRDELDQAVQYVLQATGAERVILIGYSMGGLASRAYLTKRYNDHKVKRLITIGTPHLGSPYARAWSWMTSMQSCSTSSNPLLSVPCSTAVATMRSLQGDVPFDAPALRDLRRPEDGGTYLRTLGKYAHPLDVEYVSVVGEVDMFQGIRQLSEGWVQEIFRKVLALAGGGLPDMFEPGDGVVSARSQDIMNIEYFSVDPSRKRAARTVTVGSVHVAHLQESTEVQRIALDEKPEFKSAEIMRVGDDAVAIIDMTDHLPSLCTLRLDVSTVSGYQTTIEPGRGSSQLVRTRDGIVSRYVVPLPNAQQLLNEAVTLRITITNSYGHRITATKAW
jgi:pimeloyl-ACP methyl ester carboxylesterase